MQVGCVKVSSGSRKCHVDPVDGVDDMLLGPLSVVDCGVRLIGESRDTM